ncbi:MAG: hypothetical protein CSA65_04670 [Proteobacteria bacterium]|nr:MAG: hypothetical protein CSB49_02870 [Pseudomonadota bacterium]PIE18581.1 MAG: hypothetical protein CSA65_04670 [Pseudomonadota bacterium]
MSLAADQLQIAAVGVVVASACALVGSFLLLRRMAMLGDAISHAVLPGIVVAFLISGSRSAPIMLLGAASVGLITVGLIGALQRSRRVSDDAAIGVVFPLLFALGVVLVSRYAGKVHLDLDCILHGEIAFAALDQLVIGGTLLGPRALWIGGVVLALDVLLVTLLFKELKLTSFDPALAAALGFSPLLVQQLLLGAVSFTVVGSFEAVGAILVVAMLVVPPATAYLLTDRLGTMVLLSMLLAAAAALGGYAVAARYDLSIAGSMATASGALFVLAFVLAPKHGLLGRLLGWRRSRRRLRRAIVAARLLRHGGAVSSRALAGELGWSEAEVREAMRIGADHVTGADATGPSHQRAR